MHRISRRGIALTIVISCLASTPSVAGAQDPGSRDGPVGTVLIAHGAGPDWNAPVLEVARAARTGGAVEVAFLMGEEVPRYRFQDAVRRLEEAGASRVVVVPLLASSHSSHYEQIRWLTGATDELSDAMMHHLHMGGIHRAETTLDITLTPALDASPEIAPILADRALALTGAPAEHALFLVGHGPNSAEDHAMWMQNLREVADDVRNRTGFRDVKLGMLRDDAPAPVRAEAVRSIRETIELQRALTGKPVVVVPILVSKGHVSTRKIPADLAGLDILYDGEGLLPHGGIVSWLERRVREAAATADR